ncbi:hypothetical protein [Burkholderia gladioli]|uniref:hypothetical protein n=1 Tax=Burkholderia gladioli TaxID=28095 RepID=UPI00163EC264|nr:hypothetical protein [Burkholderia gladioli]
MTQANIYDVNVSSVKPLFHQEHYQTIIGASDDWGRDMEYSRGQVMTLEVSVEASGRTYTFQAQKYRSGGLLVLPSNGRLTEFLEHGVEADPGYFELFKVLAEKRFGFIFTDTTDLSALPQSVTALHRSVVENLKAQFNACFAFTSEHFGE